MKGENFRWASESAEILLPAGREGASSLMFQLEPGPATGGLPLDLMMEVRGEPVARLEIDGRSWVRLPLAGPLPEKVVLRAQTLGAYAELDLRPLCFRVFRMDWEQRLPKGVATGSLQASVLPAGAGSQLVAAWNAMQHVINKLAHGGPLVPLTVPVTPRLRRALKAYLEWGGVVGLVINAIPRVLRKLARTALTLPGSEIFPAGSGLTHGTGWQKLNDYRGEGFRNAANGAEILAAPRETGSVVLALQVEPVKG